MTQETITYRCRKCGSTNIVKNGTNKPACAKADRSGEVCNWPQYHYKDCGAYRVMKPKRMQPENEKETIVRAYPPYFGRSVHHLNNLGNAPRPPILGEHMPPPKLGG